MYTPPPSKEELEAWGLLPSDIEPVELFEDNVPAFDLLCYMSTQWMVGVAGATGLKYEIAHHKLERAKVSPEEFEVQMDDLRVMEQAALKAMRDQRKEK